MVVGFAKFPGISEIRASFFTIVLVIEGSPLSKHKLPPGSLLIAWVVFTIPIYYIEYSIAHDTRSAPPEI